MIEHVWTLICSNVVTDSGTNNISIFNILEEIVVPEQIVQKNIIKIAIELSELWVRSDPSEPEKGKSRVDMVSPSGEVMDSTIADIDLSTYQRIRLRGLYQGLPYKGDGVYKFIVYYNSENEGEDWIQVAAIPLKISMIHPQVEQADPAPTS